MAEGKVLQWLIEEGNPVQPGVELLEVESEKTVSTIEATEHGILKRRLAQAGEVLPVGTVLGIIASNNVADSDIDSFVAELASESPANNQELENKPAVCDETAEILGRKIHYRESDKHGQSIVFIHGFGGNLGGWSIVQSALSEQFHTVSFDLPGHGSSSKSFPDDEQDFFINICEQFISHLGLQKMYVVGHSWGGLLATQLAAQAPGLVSGLTLISSSGSFTRINKNYIQSFITATRRTEIKAVLKQLFFDPNYVTRDIVEETLKYKRLDGVDNVLQRIADQFLTLQDSSDIDTIGHIPVQIIFGKEDNIAEPNIELITYPNMEIKFLERVGHMPQLEDPPAVTKLIIDFVMRQD